MVARFELHLYMYSTLCEMKKYFNKKFDHLRNLPYIFKGKHVKMLHATVKPVKKSRFMFYLSTGKS